MPIIHLQFATAERALGAEPAPAAAGERPSSPSWRGLSRRRLAPGGARAGTWPRSRGGVGVSERGVGAEGGLRSGALERRAAGGEERRRGAVACRRGSGREREEGRKRKKRTVIYIISGRWVIFYPKASEIRGSRCFLIYTR